MLFVLALEVFPPTFNVTFVFLSAWFLLFLKLAMYFLVWPLSIYFTVFTVIFGVDFLTVTFTDPVAPLILSEPVYAIFTLYIFGVSVAILILT